MPELKKSSSGIVSFKDYYYNVKGVLKFTNQLGFSEICIKAQRLYNNLGRQAKFTPALSTLPKPHRDWKNDWLLATRFSFSVDSVLRNKEFQQLAQT